MAIQSRIYWEYYLALESELIRASRYVEFDKKNFKTNSIEFAGLLLSAGSEVDVTAKWFCGKLQEQKCSGMKEYRRVILRAYPKFSTVQVRVPRFGLLLTPWAIWRVKGERGWWQGYNSVKHQRDTHYSEANLKNVLDCMSGLFALLIYSYRQECGSDFLLTPPPQLLTTARYDYPDRTARIWGDDLPDERIYTPKSLS